jgi:ribosome-binding protein aMBF1 (putative translation factor)
MKTKKNDMPQKNTNFTALTVKKMNFQEIAALIKFHRQKAGLSRNQLADLADVGKTVVFDIENGKTTVQAQTLSKILTTLNIRCVFQSPLMATFQQLKIEQKETSPCESTCGVA